LARTNPIGGLHGDSAKQLFEYYLGLIPNQYQVPVVLSAGIGATGDRKIARQLLIFLQGPAFEAALKNNAMTRR